MKLVYTHEKTRKVLIGDSVQVGKVDDTIYTVTGIEKPKTPASTGRVYVMEDDSDAEPRGYYPSVIGAEWIDREDRVNAEEVTFKLKSHYGWTVGDYATLKVQLFDEMGVGVSAGTIVRIEAIAPKVGYWNREFTPTSDPRPYFLNSCRLGDNYPRLRHDFVTIRKPRRAELLAHLRELEGKALERRLKV